MRVRGEGFDPRPRVRVPRRRVQSGRAFLSRGPARDVGFAGFVLVLFLFDVVVVLAVFILVLVVVVDLLVLLPRGVLPRGERRGGV